MEFRDKEDIDDSFDEEEEISDSENTEEEHPEEDILASDEDDVYKELEGVKNELAVCKDRLLRTTAEYDNFRKRTEKEKSKIYADATCMTILNILPVADSLDLASKASENAAEEYKKGLFMVKTQLDEALKKLGVEAFGEVGDEFNPSIHNAVSHIDEEDKEDNIISEVFQKGYMIKERVIRHAMVQVTN